MKEKTSQDTVFSQNSGTSHSMGDRKNSSHQLEKENRLLKEKLEKATLKIEKLEQDASIHSRVEQRYINLNNRLLKFINRTSLACVQWNSKLEVKSWNEAAEYTFGFSAEEVQGKNIIDLLFEKHEKEKVINDLNERIKKKDSHSIIYQSATKYGEQINCMWFNTVVEGEEDDAIGIVSLIKDVTNELEEYNSLKNKEKQLRLLFDNMTNGFILQEMMTGFEGEIIDFMYIEMNKAIQTLLGEEYEAYKFIGRTMKESYLNIDQKHFKKYKQVALEGKAYRFEEYIEKLDKVFEMLLYQPQYGQVATIINDITHIKESEKKITDQYLEILEQHKALKENSRELKKAYNEINDQNKIIEEKSKSITDSILYARQIQSALMPSQEYIDTLLPKSVLYYRPKDVVSGDFYWFAQIKNKIVMVVADCTGHGVPAALLSMIGIELLNSIVNINRVTRPDEILGELRMQYRSKLLNNDTLLMTGMDLAICTYDIRSKTLFYSGANNPLVYVKGQELYRIPGDRMTLCDDLCLEHGDFTLHKIKVDEPINLYMFSDGYEDQLGGFKTAKFTRKRFDKLISDIYALPFSRQKYIMNLKLESWMETYEQVDDVLVFGTLLE